MGDFVIEFPLWTLVQTAAFDDLGLPASLVVVTDQKDMVKSVPLFTEELLAEQFTVGGQMIGVHLLRLESQQSLQEWLPGCAERGITHVSIDPTTDPQRRSKRETAASFLARISEADPD